MTSFNYPTVVISEHQYTVCVRQNAGFCGIQWAPTDTTSPDSFDLDNAETADGLAVGYFWTRRESLTHARIVFIHLVSCT